MVREIVSPEPLQRLWLSENIWTTLAGSPQRLRQLTSKVERTETLHNPDLVHWGQSELPPENRTVTEATI